MPRELYDEMKQNHGLAEYGQSFQMDSPKEVPVYEKYVKNTQLNFGPQHPAAHGVLVRFFFSRYIVHGPLLLDRTVCRTLYSKWPSFGYFSVDISNFYLRQTLQPVQILGLFLCMVRISYRPTD